MSFGADQDDTRATCRAAICSDVSGRARRPGDRPAAERRAGRRRRTPASPARRPIRGPRTERRSDPLREPPNNLPCRSPPEHETGEKDIQQRRWLTAVAPNAGQVALPQIKPAEQASARRTNIIGPTRADGSVARACSSLGPRHGSCLIRPDRGDAREDPGELSSALTPRDAADALATLLQPRSVARQRRVLRRCSSFIGREPAILLASLRAERVLLSLQPRFSSIGISSS